MSVLFVVCYYVEFTSSPLPKKGLPFLSAAVLEVNYYYYYYFLIDSVVIFQRKF